jgi:tRNA-dependent cyclodipeptide synthase
MIKKATFKNSIRDLTKFNKFVLGISMGSNNHRGEAFKATVDCINRSGLKQGILDVSDTLKRYTLMMDMSEDEARKQAAEHGRKWVIENTEALKQFKIPVSIEHWDTWLNNPRFNEYLTQFRDAYNNSPTLRAAIAKDIDNFYCRRFNDAAQNLKTYDLSVRFYLEELAVMSIQFEDNNDAAQFYAGKELNCLKLVRSGKVPNAPKGIQNAKFYRINVYDAPANEDKKDGSSEELLYG